MHYMIYSYITLPFVVDKKLWVSSTRHNETFLISMLSYYYYYQIGIIQVKIEILSMAYG